MSDYKQTRDAAGNVTTQYDKMLRNLDDDLVKRLRDTPNWMREGFHDWKDNVRTYDRAPFEAADRIEELEAKLAEAVKEKLDAISTLDAWFDRRKLAHNAVDQAVVDAASGYLRTSRVGGMPQEESDIILGVIQDMAHLSVFADLFARATLAELEEGKDD